MTFVPEASNLFVIDIDYIVPLDWIGPWIEEHKAFLEKNYIAGRFLVSGAKVPRNGGVILAMSSAREDVEQWVMEDPFHREGGGRYTITEFQATMTARGLRSSFKPLACGSVCVCAVVDKVIILAQMEQTAGLSP